MIFGEWTQDTLREMKLDGENKIQKINNFLECGSRANAAAGTFLFECDNPMDLQFGADGAFYLLTYGNGFNVISPDAGMYKWEYVKGKRPPKAVLSTDRTDGASPLTVNSMRPGASRTALSPAGSPAPFTSQSPLRAISTSKPSFAASEPAPDRRSTRCRQRPRRLITLRSSIAPSTSSPSTARSAAKG